MPHICFVSSTIYPVLTAADIPFVGGAQVQQTIVARALRARGYRVSVLTGDHGVPDATTDDGIEIRHTPPAGRRGIRGLRRVHPRMTDVIKRLREIDPDVVYFRGAGGVLAACAWYSRRFGKKLIFAAAHDMDFLPGRIFGLERHELLLYRLGVRWSDAILVQNRQQQARLRERFGRSSVIVPNCYAESSVRNAKQDGPVLWVANVMPRKRPEMFLDLAARHPHRHFLMVGGPSGDSAEARDYFNTIEARARALSNLDMAGYVPFSAVGQYFDGASVHVSTSAAEGFPNTFLQAWIRSVPTLSFVAPTTSDDSIGTVACIDLDEMNCRLTQLLEDKESWRESSRKANQHFLTHHAVDVIIPMYERLFSRVIGQFA